MERKLNNLVSQRNQYLAEAQSALAEDNVADYNSAMEHVTNIDADIDRVKSVIEAKNRQILTSAPSAAEAKDMAEERAESLRKGHEITFSTNEMLRGIRNITLASGPIAQPVGAGTTINDNLGACSILDLVTVQDMTGMTGWEQPYTVSDMTTQVQAPAANTGAARTAADPTYGVSQIKPYEVTTTTYLDRNIAKLAPADYLAMIQNQAIRALRNKISALILLGDSESTHVMYGMANGTNKAGSSIVAASAATAIDVDLLQTLYFEYGDDLDIGANARVFLAKQTLATIGKLRGTNEKRRLFDVTPNAADANQGIISDGGVIMPFSLNSALYTGTGSGGTRVIYGDPANYLLGLFGPYTVRLDESVKAVERLYAVLGDAMVGGNVVKQNGFVVATI